jgi:cell wall assembly regulator SMI1
MSLPQEVQELFRGFPFGTPVTLEDIQRAERELGEPLPPVLRELYLVFDGFNGPTSACFFWTLFGDEGLVGFNQFFRNGEEFPHELVSSCIFFGDGGAGPMWGIKRDLPNSVILWDPEWDGYEVVGKTPLDAWSEQKRVYDEVARERKTGK